MTREPTEASLQADLYDVEALRQTPIPEIHETTAGFRDIPITPSAEPLVPTGMFTDVTLYTSSIYAGEHGDSPYGDGLPNSLRTMYMRGSVAKRLSEVERRLPDGFHLIVYDAYRTLELQKSLYDRFYGELQDLHPDWEAERLADETRKKVSLPSSDPSKPSTHNTGGSVDVGLIELPPEIEARIKLIDDELKAGTTYGDALEIERHNLITAHARTLDFGVPFDYGGEDGRGLLDYLEGESSRRELTAQEQAGLRNRRLLYHIMVSVGMQPYKDEWWHYNAPETQMGAETLGMDHASFGPMALTDELLAVEHKKTDLASGLLVEAPNFEMAAVIAP